ncbi:hypothetical protein PHLGIDRAFT_129084 [Phlebiopsis gigantea 11061_1 CR5-6]|uniref:Ketoreductase (KR) domain-containing protein n=1 Tax=Phlebiopsis gigantea (strain 11061_1 CR5-6) TaxID=745531 RepID=A0A0C3PGY7_PHLG1|nr:hypothetical protein PHLGIDRAFT_129084 [Phlebiopsis gigantea 11061_1 CR5-6]
MSLTIPLRLAPPQRPLVVTILSRQNSTNVNHNLTRIQKVNNVAGRLGGTYANGYKQSDVDGLHGRTALVTGPGTGGVGFEVFRAMALASARVLDLSRKEENAEEAIAMIRESGTQNGIVPGVAFVQCDHGDLKVDKRVVDQISLQEGRMDIVICGAGIGVNKYGETVDGLDRHMTVNHLGHFLLVNHVFFFSVDELRDSSISAVGLSGRSKLANLLFTKSEQHQFKAAYGPLLGTLFKHTVVPFMRAPDQGSLSPLWAATSAELDAHNYEGRYFTDPGELGEENDLACDPELGRNLWNLSERIIREKVGPDALLSWHAWTTVWDTK